MVVERFKKASFITVHKTGVQGPKQLGYILHCLHLSFVKSYPSVVIFSFHTIAPVSVSRCP